MTAGVPSACGVPCGRGVPAAGRESQDDRESGGSGGVPQYGRSTDGECLWLTDRGVGACSEAPYAKRLRSSSVWVERRCVSHRARACSHASRAWSGRFMAWYVSPRLVRVSASL